MATAGTGIPSTFSSEVHEEIEVVQSIFESQLHVSMIDRNLMKVSFRRDDLVIDFYINGELKVNFSIFLLIEVSN